MPRGAKFEFEMVYNVENTSQIEDDLKNLKLAIDLLQMDSLGGHGSRGYGKVEIRFECIKGMSVKYLKGEDEKAVKEITSLDDVAELIEIFKNGGSPEGQ